LRWLGSVLRLDESPDDAYADADIEVEVDGSTLHFAPMRTRPAHGLRGFTCARWLATSRPRWVGEAYGGRDDQREPPGRRDLGADPSMPSATRSSDLDITTERRNDPRRSLSPVTDAVLTGRGGGARVLRRPGGREHGDARCAHTRTESRPPTACCTKPPMVSPAILEHLARAGSQCHRRRVYGATASPIDDVGVRSRSVAWRPGW
jgi:hypothetical protein